MPRSLPIAWMILAVASVPSALAQPAFLKDAIEGATGGANRRNDLEGGIWEYKVLDRKGDKETMLVGKIRIKEGGAFDVAGSAEGKLIEGEADKNESGGARPFGIKPPSGPNLGVLDRIAEGNRGGDRIADVSYKKSRNSTTAAPKVTFQFDTDDKHPLSGEAQVKLDTRKNEDVWRGSYYEQIEVDGKKKKRRWNFELRFIED